MPDFVFYGGTILTMDPRQPSAEALAVRGGRVVALGDVGGVLDMARKDTERIDLDGCYLLPGFHDAHVHLTQHGLELSRLKLQEVPTLDEGLRAIAAHAAELREGEWLLGAGFSMSRWSVNRLTRQQLDAAAPKNPVFLQSQDHHSAWVNSLALELAGVHAATPDPPEGSIERDDRGEPTGLLLERAAKLVTRAIPMPGDRELHEALMRAGHDLAELGITTVHHMAYENAAYWRQLALAASSEDYPLRVWACIDQENVEHAAAIGLATGQGGQRFMIGGAKFFADGALGSLTAWMLEPYDGTATCGTAVHGPEVLAERLPIVIDAGFTPVVHAIGDAANRAVLDALEKTLPQWQARHLRPRVEHAQHLHPDDVPRFARLGVVASMQPIHLTFDAKRLHELLAQRLSHAYVFRSLAASGAHLAFGSDTPVASPDVRLGLKAACQREEESLTAEEALAAYTRGAAYAIGRENRSGQLRPGFDADFVIVSRDPRKHLDFEIEGTMVAGRWTKAF